MSGLSLSRRICNLVFTVVAAQLIIPPLAHAHAQVERTVPALGAVVKSAPPAVVFTFSEAVEGAFGSVRVFSATGQRVDQGGAFHPGGHSDQIAVGVQRVLAEGSYTATYRVVSADSHVVSGGFVFSVVRTGQSPRQSVAQLAGSSAVDTSVDATLGVARAIQFLAIAIAVGAVVFLLAVWRPEMAAARHRRQPETLDAAFRIRTAKLFMAVASAGIAASLFGIVAQGALADGVSVFGGTRPSVFSATIETRFGVIWSLAAVAWTVIALVANRSLRDRRRWASVLLSAALALVVAIPALSGHAATVEPIGLFGALNLVHVVSVSVWVGGLVCLASALPAASRLLADPQRVALSASILTRFSPIALGSVIVILLTGLIQSLVALDSFEQVTTTAYGRALLVKAGLLLILIALGFVQRRLVIPRLKAAANLQDKSDRLGRRVVIAEIGLLILVFVATAALAAYSPSDQPSSGPISRTASIGPAQIQLTVDPAKPGVNQIHIYLINPRTGAQFTAAREVLAAETLAEPSVGPLRQSARKAGPGHWIIGDAGMTMRGRWSVRISMRVSEFDEYSVEEEIPIG